MQSTVDPIQERQVHADVKLYVRQRLFNDPELSRWLDHLRKQIKGALIKGAKSMFRCVALQLGSLRSYIRPRQLFNALEYLPQDLDWVYERILDAFDQQFHPDVKKLLHCL
jgi:gluconate kinase